MPMRGRMGRGWMMEDDDDERVYGRGMMGPGMMQRLNLSDDQQTKMRVLFRSHAKARIQKQAEIAVARLDLQQLLEAEDVEMSQVKRSLSDIAAKEVDVRFARITMMQHIRNLLTPEQRQQFRSMCGAMIDEDGRMGCGQMQRRGRHMGRGGMMRQSHKMN